MESEQTHSGDLYSLLGWLDKNRKQIISTAVIVAIVGVIVAFFVWRKSEKEIAAGEAISALMLSGSHEAPKADALLKVANENPGTDAGARALLAAAGLTFADGKTADAQNLFQKFLTDYEGNSLTPQAKLGIAACLEASGKTNEALSAFKEVVDRFVGENTATPAKFSLARLYEAQGKLEQARDLYMDLARDAQSTFGTEAISRLTAIIQAHPELRPGAAMATTNAPATLPAQPAK
jgi:predicted negative regulator of RcsB-dependent stress response